MTGLTFISDSEQATFDFGAKLGRAIQHPLLIFLSGTLGTGKTRLVQAVASGLNIDPNQVQSPTFTLMTPHSGRMMLVHVDAYRIKDIDEVQQLGLDDWIENGCVMMIEWAERIGDALPAPDIRASIEHIDETTRRFKFESNSDSGALLLAGCQSQ